MVPTRQLLGRGIKVSYVNEEGAVHIVNWIYYIFFPSIFFLTTQYNSDTTTHAHSHLYKHTYANSTPMNIFEYFIRKMRGRLRAELVICYFTAYQLSRRDGWSFHTLPGGAASSFWGWRGGKLNWYASVLSTEHAWSIDIWAKNSETKIE